MNRDDSSPSLKRWTLIVLAVIGVVGTAPVGARQNNPARRVIDVVAERFAFSPSEITVAQGTTIEFRLTSDDTSHGFRLIGPGPEEINVEIPKRGRGDVRVTFEATQVGRYAFECSHVCGAGHSFMRGTLRVVDRGSSDSPGRGE